MDQRIERRNLTQEFRVSNDDNVIYGYAAIFDTPSENLGGWVETIDPHAFDSVMATNPDVRALWNHNPDHVLGRTSSNTLRLGLDARGLAYNINPPDTTLAKDLIVSMKRRDVTQSSFSFVCKRDQWTDNQDGTVTRRILEFEELIDISPVTFPAYDAATAQARSLPASMPSEMRSRLSARSTASIDLDVCECNCAQCRTGACGICSGDPQCGFAQRSTVCERDRMKMRLSLLALQK